MWQYWQCFSDVSFFSFSSLFPCPLFPYYFCVVFLGCMGSDVICFCYVSFLPFPLIPLRRWSSFSSPTLPSVSFSPFPFFPFPSPSIFLVKIRIVIAHPSFCAHVCGSSPAHSISKYPIRSHRTAEYLWRFCSPGRLYCFT